MCKAKEKYNLEAIFVEGMGMGGGGAEGMFSRSFFTRCLQERLFAQWYVLFQCNL